MRRRTGEGGEGRAVESSEDVGLDDVSMDGGDFIIGGVAALMNGRGCFYFHFFGSEEGWLFELRL